eukprot:225361_1
MSTQYPSNRDPSVNSSAIPNINRFEIGLQTKSLAQCCTKKIYILIPILVILGTYAIMIDQGLYCHTTITDVNISIKEPTPKTIPKVINGPSIPTSISWFWDGDAHWNAVINCFGSIIW